LCFVTEHSCYKDRGDGYRGIEDHAASGRPCMPWSNQQSALKPAEYPELSGGHNFCRNPGAQEESPWCFVGPTHRELCNLTQCGKQGESKTN
jgi:receptor tyrosine kinase-like orphan receptor 1